MKMRRRALSVLLSLAVVFTFMPFVSQQAFAASKTKVQLIKLAQNNKGDNVKYTYYKDGLVKTEKSTTKSKDSDSDTTYTTYTKYTYKKGRIKKAITTDTTTTTYYKTDYTTGKNIVATEGTVKTTEKYVTDYTYKKGAAIKAITTKTTTKNGTLTETENKRDFFIRVYDDDDYYGGGYEMLDGSLVAYWRTDASGNRVPVLFTGATNDAVGDTTTVTTYTDLGNGTYKVNTKKDTKNSNFRIEDVKDSEGVVTAKNVVIYNGNKDTISTTSEKTVTDKEVTTTNFKNDKKKRASSAVSTVVKTDESTSGPSTEAYTFYFDDGSSHTTNETTNTVVTNSTTNTKVDNFKWGYKKGRVIKEKITNDGYENSVNVVTTGLPSRTYDWADSDGTSGGSTTSATGAAYASKKTTTVANGTRTVTDDTQAYTTTITNKDGTSHSDTTTAEVKTTTKPVKPYPTTEEVKYAYDKKGNLKSAKHSLNNIEYATVYNETYGNPIYQGYNADGDLEVAERVVYHNKKFTEKYENTLKNGSKRLAKKLMMTASQKYDRAVTPGYSIDGRVVYKFNKAKKFSSKKAKNIELQQWMLQNSVFSGTVGL